MKSYSIAAIPGDGIGNEVIPASLKVLDALQSSGNAFELKITSFPWGSDYYRSTGRMMPEDGLDQLRGFDAIFFGAVGDSRLPDDLTLWGLRLAICQGFDQYANVRPIRLLRGVRGPLRDVAPADLDLVIVRENTEGEYSGIGGRVHRGLPEEIATETSVFTRSGIARIMRFACDLAMRRRRRLTVVTKSNAQRHGMKLWDEIAEEIVGSYPGLVVDRMLVDAMTARMVLRPASLDVVVATNLQADILSDLGAALAGSLGLAATANLNPERQYPSMFEPIHGSALDIAGKGIANPIGAFWSAAMMLDHLGEFAAAARLMQAIEKVVATANRMTPDLGGGATTAEVTEAVCQVVFSSGTR